VVRLLNLICNLKGIGLRLGQDMADPGQTPEACVLHVDQDVLDELQAYLDTTLPFFQGLYTKKE